MLEHEITQEEGEKEGEEGGREGEKRLGHVRYWSMRKQSSRGRRKDIGRAARRNRR